MNKSGTKNLQSVSPFVCIITIVHYHATSQAIHTYYHLLCMTAWLDVFGIFLAAVYGLKLVVHTSSMLVCRCAWAAVQPSSALLGVADNAS